MRLKMASRKSDLARLQLQTVGKYLEQQLNAQPEFIYSESFGDKNLDIDLKGAENKGLFTKDFYEAIVNQDVDMVVHSWKDLPIEDNKTSIAMTLPRHDARDLLLVKKSSLEKIILSKTIEILTSSPRREFFLSKHLKKLYPAQLDDVKFAPIRGNIPTRLKKLLQSDSDALVMAKAALDRMLSAEGEEFESVKNEIKQDLAMCEWMVLPLKLFPSAAAQGALAVEVLKGSSIEQKLKNINCKTDFAMVKLERAKLKELGGGCHSRLGVNYLSRSFGTIFYLSHEVDGELHKVTKILRDKEFEKVDEQFVWPGNQSVPATRETITINLNEIKKFNGLYVTKLSAMPDGFTPEKSQVVWTSGLITWQKLAKKGIWVHGSSESLGETEPMRLDELTGGPLKWAKLSHINGAKTEKTIIGTYRVHWNFKKEDLLGCKHFYWMSGEMFKQALEACPEIIEASHYCGPGHTYEALKPLIDKSKLFVCLGYEDWKKEIIK